MALHLAQVLQVPVEELFSIEMPASASEKSTPVDPLMGPAKSGQLDQPMRLAKVGRRIIAVPSSPVVGELPAVDAAIIGPGHGGRSLVRPFHVEADKKNRLIIAGCDPAMPMLTRHVWKHGSIELIIAVCSSRAGCSQ